MPLISATGLSKNYGKTQALIDFTMAAQPGETVGLIGLNGAGKSTFIKTLLGFLRPTAGTVLLRGEQPSNPASRRGVGYLPEVLTLPRNLTPFEFLQFSGRLSGLKNPDSQVVDTLTRVKLPEQAWRRPIRTLSKGQLQRLGLANALLGGEELLVLDEPASGLDPVGRRDVKDLLRGVKRDGKSVFLTSHILGEVEEVCDQVCVLHEGRLLFMGTTREFLGTDRGVNLESAFLRCIGAAPPS